MRVCVFSVIYSERFLNDFLYFWTKQFYTDFDFLFVNEGIDITPYPLDRCKQIFYKGTIAENRMVGLDYAKEHYDYLIFADSDDYCSATRIGKSVELLMKGFDIVANELFLMDEKGFSALEPTLSNIYDNNQIITKMPRMNIFGFGNTAVNLHKVKKEDYDFPVNDKILDKIFFKNMFKRHCKAVFTNDCQTYYRQYEGQTMGWERLKKGEK